MDVPDLLLEGGKARPCLCCIAPSPIRIQALISSLDKYPDRKAAQVLKQGFSKGFSIGYNGPRLPVDCKNLTSARANHNVVMGKLRKEINLGRIAGPYVTPPIPNLRVSPIGLVPKSCGNAFRLIHHLSWPDGNSVNDWIDKEDSTVKYTSFDDAVQCIAISGQSTLMAKSDIKSAFRLLPVRPQDFELLGMKAGGYYFVDKCLPMGVASAPSLFETFSTFIEWVTKERGQCDRVIHYCDDFLVYGGHGSGKDSCLQVLQSFQGVCNELGVPLAEEKTEGPKPAITFLGLEIDAANQRIRIPQCKLVKLRAIVAHVSNARKLRLRELQSVIGSLSFVCKAVPPGRAFLRRLINLTMGVKKACHRVRINQESREDLQMWSRFLESCNGATIIPEQVWLENSDIQMFTDASGSIGFGGYFQGAWFQGRWPQHVSDLSPSITWREFFPIVVAVSVWGRLLAGKRVIFRSDNKGVVSIINKQSSHCPRIMRLVRFFVMKCLVWNVAFRATHIPGKEIEIADSLSRFQDSRFRSLAPGANLTGVEVPKELWDI